MLPNLHTGFSRVRSGSLVFPSLSEFSTVYYDPHSQRHINKAEIDVFLELSCFFDDPADVGNLIWFFCLFKNQLEHLEFRGSCIAEFLSITLLACEMCAIVW